MAGKSLLITLVLCASVVGARAALASRGTRSCPGRKRCSAAPWTSRTSHPRPRKVGDPVLCHLGPISSFGHSLFPAPAPC